MEHVVIPASQRHGPFSWEVNNQVAREALSTTTGDVGKLAWQKDNDSVWILRAVGIWARVGHSPLPTENSILYGTDSSGDLETYPISGFAQYASDGSLQVDMPSDSNADAQDAANRQFVQESISAISGQVGAWSPSSLGAPPKVYFDASTSEGLITITSGSRLLATASSKFNSGTYSGSAQNVAVNIRNPRFNNRRTFTFPGSNSRLGVTGGLAIGQNKSAITLAIFGCNQVETGTVLNSGTILAYIGSNTVDALRAAISRSTTLANGLRYGGRRLDADTADMNDIGGSQGTTPFVVIARFDYANATKNIRINGVQDTDASFQTAGSTSNTASEYVAFGASSSGGTSSAPFDAEVLVMDDTLWSDAQCLLFEAYWPWRAGMPEIINATNPYKLAPP